MLEAEALCTVYILLESLSILRKDKSKVKAFTLKPFKGPAEGQVYHKVQKKPETCFFA